VCTAAADTAAALGSPTHPSTHTQVSESELTKYFSKHPRARLGGWQNVMPARGLPDLFGYAPIAHVSGGMRTPTIIMAMEQDAMCPYEDMVTAAQLCGANCLLLTEQGSYVHSKPMQPPGEHTHWRGLPHGSDDSLLACWLGPAVAL